MGNGFAVDMQHCTGTNISDFNSVELACILGFLQTPWTEKALKQICDEHVRGEPSVVLDAASDSNIWQLQQ